MLRGHRFSDIEILRTFFGLNDQLSEPYNMANITAVYAVKYGEEPTERKRNLID